MTCHDYEAAIVDAARGVATELESAARAHAAQCTACAARLRREETLSIGFRRLAASAAVPDGSALEAHLLERFDAEQTVTARRVSWSQRWFAAAAAIVMIAGLGAAWRTVRSQPAAADPYTVASRDEAYQFVPWPGAASLPAFESGQLVRTELPASVLPLLGISQAGAPADGHVIADVLYGQDGLARAVRLVKAQSTQP